MKDVRKNRILNCKIDDKECNFDLITYIWEKRQEPKCQSYHLKKVRGTLTEVDEGKFFTAKDNLIHLRLDKRPIDKCGKKVYGTDVDKIYILNLKEEEPITIELSAENLSIMRDYSIRDSWVFNRMTQILKESIIQIARKHCHDTRISRANCMRIVTNNKLNSVTPFSFAKETSNFP